MRGYSIHWELSDDMLYDEIQWSRTKILKKNKFAPKKVYYCEMENKEWITWKVASSSFHSPTSMLCSLLPKLYSPWWDCQQKTNAFPLEISSSSSMEEDLEERCEHCQVDQLKKWKDYLEILVVQQIDSEDFEEEWQMWSQIETEYLQIVAQSQIEVVVQSQIEVQLVSSSSCSCSLTDWLKNPILSCWQQLFLFEIKKKRRFTLRRIKIFLFHDVNNICWSFKRSSSDIMIMQDLKEWKKRGKKYLYRGVDQHCIVTKEVFQIHCFQLFRVIPNQSGENSSEGERRDVLLREDFRNSFDYIFGESCWLWKLGCEGKRTYLPIGFLLVLIQYEMTFCLGFRTGLTWSLKKKRRSPKYLDNGIPPEFWGRRTFSGER